MRVVFIGAVEFSLHALLCLIEEGVNIVGVCTTQESKHNSDHIDLTGTCNKNNIPCFNCADINNQNSIEWIASKKPEVIFCFGWSRILNKEILNIAPMGVVGFHPAALPHNRGRHPLIWALVLGLKETASTFFFMKEGADDGDILSQAKIVITEGDDARSLYNKMTHTALIQIKEFIPSLFSGNFERMSQDGLQFNVWRKRSMLDGQIDWRMSARSINNLVRGLAKPYLGAHFVHKNKEFKVWKTNNVDGVAENLEPGKVVGFQNGFPVIKCGEGAICLLVAEPKIQLIYGEYL
jgi:methionyl-tRNA formyltransferase